MRISHCFCVPDLRKTKNKFLKSEFQLFKLIYSIHYWQNSSMSDPDMIANLSRMLDMNADAPPAPAGRVHFIWTDNAMKLLINSAYKQEAYKKTSMNMELKWEMVRSELIAHDPFRNHPEVTAKNLRQKFNRFKDDVNKKYALEQEGANLSGLAEHISDCDEMMVGILQELAEMKDERDENKEKASKNQVVNIIYLFDNA